MLRSLRWAGAASIALALTATNARAQFGYTYPGGYGGWGWGGWGGQTVLGDQARGMGMFAAGVGQYNVQTAQANSINADTLMRFNQYLFESQQNLNMQHYERTARQSERVNTSREAIYKRLRDNPRPEDIMSGDALNVAFNQIAAPGVYTASMKQAQVPIPSSMIKDIPFNKASEGVTLTLNQLTDAKNWPAELRADALDPERANLRKVATEARAEDDAGDLKPETIEKLYTAMKAYRDKVFATYAPDSPERRKVTPYLKGLGGLIRLLDQPELQVLLRNVDEQPERSLADVINFMVAFNLRFGVADTPRERAVYNQLYPLLDNLRKAVAKPDTGMPVAAAGEHAPSDVTDFFGKMDASHIHQPGAVPSVPSHKPAPPPPPANP